MNISILKIIPNKVKLYFFSLSNRVIISHILTCKNIENELLYNSNATYVKVIIALCNVIADLA